MTIIQRWQSIAVALATTTDDQIATLNALPSQVRELLRRSTTLTNETRTSVLAALETALVAYERHRDALIRATSEIRALVDAEKGN